MPKMQPDVFSSPVIKRYNGGKPVLSKEDIPYPADLVFNAGVAKFGGNYVRLERPMPVYSRGGKDRFDIWLSESPDMRFWGKSRLLMGGEDVQFANDKIGPGAPPIKTEKGWLTLFHAVQRDPLAREKRLGKAMDKMLSRRHNASRSQ